MKGVISFFVAHPLLYHLLAISTLVGLCMLALRRDEEPTNRRTEIAFLAFAAGTLFVWRWPAMLWPQPLNIDEGHWAALALKTTYDLAPWRSFDGTTSGPLNSNILALPALFGAEITFFSTRLIGCLLLIIATFAFYFAVKWTLGALIARLSVVAPTSFLALTWEWDFAHYTSEYLPVCLIMIGVAAGCYVLKHEGVRTALLVGGICLGSTGFAKLQALPVGLAVLLFIWLAIIYAKRPPAAKRVELVIVTLAFLLVPLAMTISLYATDHVNDAVISYLNSAVVHVATGSTVGFEYFFRTTVTYTVFLVCVLVAVAVGLLALRGRWRPARRSIAVGGSAIAFLLVSLFVIITPRHAYPHYLLFSVFPLSFCLAAVLSFTRDAGLWREANIVVPAAVVLLFTVPALSAAMASPNAFLGQMPRLLKAAGPEISSLLPLQSRKRETDAISRHAMPGTLVAIWGWMPHYYVQTQTIPATRDAHTKPQLTPGPYQDYFRERFLADVQNHRPRVIVDAVAPRSFGYDDRASQGVECFPALAEFIAANYQLVEEVRGMRVFTMKPGNP